MSRTRLEEIVRIKDKQLRYIAFVLTGNSNADPQLAADKVKEMLENLEQQVKMLRTKVTNEYS